MSELDDALRKRALQLASAYERELGAAGCGLMILLFSKQTENLDLVAMTSTENPGESLKILREAQRLYMREQRAADERWFALPENESRSGHLISAVAVVRMGGHDRVRLWSRGALAGELVVEAGDGERVAAAHGLTEQP